MKDEVQGFEEALRELEDIVESLEEDDLQLAEALLLFERGVERLRFATGQLDAAHGRVEELVRGLSGDLEVVALEAEAEENDRPGAQTDD